MNRRIKVKSFRKLLLNVISLIMIIVIAVLVMGHNRSLKKQEEKQIISTINQKKDIQHNIKKDDISNSKEVTKKNNDVPNKKYFKDDLFLGDSITESMSFFDILDEKNVKGIIGLTIPKAIKIINKIEDKDIKNIFILLGNNDIDNDIDINMNNYKKLLHKIKKILPKSKINVQGVLPVTEKAVKQDKCLTEENINKFNEALKRNCEKEDVNFIDLTDLVKNMAKSVYEPDGIHFKEPFYHEWLDYIKNTLKE